jgi:hypothetical protein
MNTYQKYKQNILDYFHTEIGRQAMKEAQKRYRHTEEGRQKNCEIRRKCYYKAKIFTDEFKRLNCIQMI